jgi:phosphohistidine phosphatase
MWLYLVHHADAVTAEVDSTRPLSSRGRAQATDVARRVAARQARPVAIWHSGKLRARETAEIYLQATNPAATFTATRGLQPDDDPEWMRDALAGETDDLMIVGHYPYLPTLLQLLAGDQAVFPQHGAVALERAESGWIERWREPGLTT